MDKYASPDELWLDCLAEAIAGPGYAIYAQALPPALVDALWQEMQALPESELKRAGIGRQDSFQLNRDIRRDRIHWLDGQTGAQAGFLAWMECLRLGLNQRLFMGLFDYESHYAHYGAGAFYKKHLDAFKLAPDTRQARRVLSTVLYLNRDWQFGDGGELLLYRPDDTGVLEVIAPMYGRLLVFLSDEFPHEVALARRERQSLAGWFRTQGDSWPAVG